MADEILKNIYRIAVPLPKNPLRYTNDYVIKGGERDILIDTAFNLPECREALSAGLRELGVRPERLDVVLTHCHGDHSGIAPELGKLGAGVHLARDEQGWMFGENLQWSIQLDGIKLTRAGFDPELVEKYILRPRFRHASSDGEFTSYTPIDEGREFDCGGHRLRAVLTPGHTPAHMCFFLEESKTMFVGDTLLFDVTPNITLWNCVVDSLGDYLDSLKLLDGYDVELALPGHRETGDFHARIAALQKHHEDRLSECFDIVCKYPNMTAYDTAGKMSWHIRCNDWDDFPLGQKWFAVGECHSHLRHLAMLGEIIEDDSEELLRFRPR